MKQNQLHRTCRRKPGFTLIEVVTSLSIMSVLMLGLSGSLMISVAAIPRTDEYAQSDAAVHSAMTMVRDDLRLTTKVVILGSKGSDFTVSLVMGSNGAIGESSAIVYQFNKSAGSLTRKTDSDATVVLISNIKSLDIVPTLDGTNVRVLQIVLEVNGTMQGLFERHFILPNRPGVI